MHRRTFLSIGAAVTAGLVVKPDVSALASVFETPPPPPDADGAFFHGVASGDPRPTSVILWTRVTTASPTVSGTWQVATDAAMVDVVAEGGFTAGPERDHCVKIDATGLPSQATLWYRFVLGDGTASPLGRTKTTAAGGLDHARLAVVTCSDYSRGLYNAYARVAELADDPERDVDCVVHLGDYIYENDRDRVRAHEPPVEVRTLDEYRARYASYRLDPALAAVHANHPMIWVWDDHETVDGTWTDGADPSNHGDDPEEGDGTFAARKAAARTAAFDWLPIRETDLADPLAVYRRFAFGDLIDLFMLDTRHPGRQRQGENDLEAGFTQQGVFADPDRQLLGEPQERWLFDGMASSTTAWRFLGNQVVMSPLKLVGLPRSAGGGVFANPDQWDGYEPARDRLLGSLDDRKNLVVLTGDVHASIALEVTDDPNDPTVYDGVTGSGSYGVELVTPSISSAGDPPRPEDTQDEGDLEDLVLANGEAALMAPNPHLKYIESGRNGYLLVDVTRTQLRAEFWLVPTVTAITDEQTLDQTFWVDNGDPRLKRVENVPPAVVPEIGAPALLAAAGAAAVVSVARHRRRGDDHSISDTAV